MVNKPSMYVGPQTKKKVTGFYTVVNPYLCNDALREEEEEEEDGCKFYHFDKKMQI